MWKLNNIIKKIFLCCSAFASAVCLAEVKWEVASWDMALGSHRALIKVSQKADTVLVTIPWRRPDQDAEKRGMILIDLTTGKRVTNFALKEFSREYVDLVFEPQTVPGEYALYYLPLQKNPQARLGQSTWQYMPYNNMADEIFLDRAGLGANRYLEAGILENMPRAELIAMQARTEHDSFYPMNVIAAEAEVEDYKSNFPDDFLIFPEDRKYPVSMTDYLPQKWVQKAPARTFCGEALKGEFYAFQTGVFAAQRAIEDMQISWSDFTSASAVISAENMELINRDIIDIYGNYTQKQISVPKDKVQALWFIVSVPEDAAEGDYTSTITFSDGGTEHEIKVVLTVLPGDPIEFNGTLDGWRMARLKWLNIPAGLSENIPVPYREITVNGNVIDAAGKITVWGADGYPQRISVYGHEVLSAPVEMDITAGDVSIMPDNWVTEAGKLNDGIAGVIACAQNEFLTIVNNVRVEYDGYMFFNTVITANTDLDISDINLYIPYDQYASKYIMGFDTGIGGLRPENVDWKWQDRPNNKVWIGNVEAGMRIKLRGAKELEDIWSEVRPEVDGIPETWNNGGKGGATVSSIKGEALVTAYTGSRTLNAGETLEMNFSLLPTPVKPRDPETYLPPIAWESRTSFMAEPSINKNLGATNAVIFHGTPPNPCINYPLYTWQKIAAWSEEAEKIGQNPWLYYKVGELSNFTSELMALKSLNGEIITRNNSTGDPWLMEHMGFGNFSPRWCCTPFGQNGPSDASVNIEGGSRWENYYMNSMEVIIKKGGIRGLYFDGLGYSRYFMQRLRTVTSEICSDPFILDFHCGNTITRRSNTYLDVMEHLPYFDTTWIGEGFNYDRGPDFYMVELSGIPYGVPNSMLQYGGNPYRGLLYGMTTRPLGNHTSNPSHLWTFFDRVNIKEALLIGYWEEENCPVSTDNGNTLCSVYKFPDNRAIIAVATWENSEVVCNIEVDWEKLGINPETAVIYTPQIPAFQDEQFYDLSEPVTIPGKKGFLFMIEEKPSLGRLISDFDSRVEPQTFSLEGAQISMTAPEAGTVNLTADTVSVTSKRASTAFITLPLPENAVGISCRVRCNNPVEKQPYDWHERFDGLNAPGIGVYTGDQQKFFRVYEASYGVWCIDDMVFDHMYIIDSNWKASAPDDWIYLRIYWDDSYIVAESSRDGETWNILYALQREQFPEALEYIRIGKMPKTCGWPMTLKEEVSGPDQSADFTDLKVYFQK